MRHSLRTFFLGVLAFTIYSSAQAEEFKFSVWSEFLPYQEILDKGLLEKLKSKNIDLHLAMSEEVLRDEQQFAALVKVLEKAKELKVEVRSWPVLSKEDGYWASKWTIKKLGIYIESLLKRLEERGVKPKWIILDMEPHYSLFTQMNDRLEERDTHAAVRLIKAWNEEYPYGYSYELFRRFLKKMHAQNVKVHAVTVPQVLDDIKEGNRNLQYSFGIPIENLDWDEVSFMVYRPVFARMFDGIDASFVYSYAVDTFIYYGDMGSIDLGPVGASGIEVDDSYFRDPKDLAKDLGFARGAGVEKAHVFSLEGILSESTLDSWLVAPLPQVPRLVSDGARRKIKGDISFLPSEVRWSKLKDFEEEEVLDISPFLLRHRWTGPEGFTSLMSVAISCDPVLATYLIREDATRSVVSQGGWTAKRYVANQISHYKATIERMEKTIEKLKETWGFFDARFWDARAFKKAAEENLKRCEKTQEVLNN